MLCLRKMATNLSSVFLFPFDRTAAITRERAALERESVTQYSPVILPGVFVAMRMNYTNLSPRQGSLKIGLSVVS